MFQKLKLTQMYWKCIIFVQTKYIYESSQVNCKSFFPSQSTIRREEIFVAKKSFIIEINTLILKNVSFLFKLDLCVHQMSILQLSFHFKILVSEKSFFCKSRFINDIQYKKKLKNVSYFLYLFTLMVRPKSTVNNFCLLEVQLPEKSFFFRSCFISET